jgi:hypothetical protein
MNGSDHRQDSIAPSRKGVARAAVGTNATPVASAMLAAGRISWVGTIVNEFAYPAEPNEQSQESRTSTAR